MKNTGLHHTRNLQKEGFSMRRLNAALNMAATAGLLDQPFKKLHSNPCGFSPGLPTKRCPTKPLPPVTQHRGGTGLVFFFWCESGQNMKEWMWGVACWMLGKSKKRFPKWWDLIVIYHGRTHKKHQHNDSRMLMVHDQNSEFDLEQRFHNMATIVQMFSFLLLDDSMILCDVFFCAKTSQKMGPYYL